MTTPNPSQLRKALDQNDKQQLLSVWAGQTFWALFGEDEHGIERPISVVLGEQLAVLVAQDEEKSKTLINAVDSDPNVRTFVKSAPLSEMARLAYSDGGTLMMIGESILFPPSSLLLLGYTALFESDKEEPVYWRIKTFPFEGDGGADMAPGCVQRWSLLSGRKANKAPRIIFDDSLDWRHNPNLLKLPSKAVPASSLSEQERAVFKSRALPSLEDVPVPINTADDDGMGFVASRAMPDKYLAGPKRLLTQVEEFLFPVAKRLKLDVQLTDESSIRFDFQYLDEEYTINGVRITPVSLYKESLAVQELGHLSYRLPTEPGLHPVPAPLKGLLKRYLAWGMFSESRRLDGGFNLLGGQLRNLISAFPDNSDKPFYCDPGDQRFPYLARFRCAGQSIPVLVLGQQGDNYVCNAMEYAEIADNLVPEDIPFREGLISNGNMKLWELSGSVLLPSRYLDCPASWYEGVRLSARWMLADTRKCIVMLSQAMKSEQAA